MIVSITGHRPDKLGGYKTPNAVYDAVKEGLRKHLLELKPDFVVTGMALGTDQWAAEVCVDEKIPFIAAVPFEGQEGKWPPESQERYKKLLACAHQIYIISPGGYEPNKMHIRNRWMVQVCDVLLAVFDGSVGGTSACVKAAESAKKTIVKVELSNYIWALAKSLKEKKDYASWLKKGMNDPELEKKQVSMFVASMKEKSASLAQTMNIQAVATSNAQVQHQKMLADAVEAEKAKTNYLKAALDALKETNTKLEEKITVPQPPLLLPMKKKAVIPKYKKPLNIYEPSEEFEEEEVETKTNPLSLQGFGRKLDLDE